MSLKKRSKVDVSILEESLPLSNLQLCEQNNHSLRKALEQYRKDNESLNRNNLLLARKNDVLESLLSSVSSLWDSLNADLDLYLSRHASESGSSEGEPKNGDAEPEGPRNGAFWEKIATTKFPFAPPTGSEEALNLDELAFMFDGDEFLLPVDAHDENEWSKVRDDFLNAKVALLDAKKDALFRSVTRSRRDSKFDESGVVKVLKYNCLHLGKLFFLVYDRYKGLKASFNGLKVEVSRLNKQNAFLKFELKSFSTDESKKDIESSSSSSESDADPCKLVENIEEVTEEMVIGSSLYSRLFSYAKNMDKEIARLEAENSELRTQVSKLSEKPGDDFFGFKKEFDEFTADLVAKLDAFESKYIETTREFAALQESYRFAREELAQYKLEREKMMDELNQREVAMSRLLRQNASICKSLSTQDPGDSAAPTPAEPGSSPALNQNAGVEFYKEQLLNISEELEEVSVAFEKKQKMCDELMRQMNEVEATRQKLAKLEASYNSLLERFNKLVSVTNCKVAAYTKQNEALEQHVKSYKQSWAHAFKRACFMQHQRDVAVSAVCELQSQYRKSCRSQKALQDYLSVVRSGVVRTSSVDGNLGDLENAVSQENAILRRRMICSVCSENFRDQVITKCGHVFCSSCLTSSIKSRNRKCPQCKITFDKNDTQKIFLD